MVFVLQEQPHAEFKRKGDDLFVERTISLSEALCGFSMEVRAIAAAPRTAPCLPLLVG